MTVAAHPVRIGGRVKPRWGVAGDASNFGGIYRFQSLADVSLGRPFLFSRRSGPSEVAFSDVEADVLSGKAVAPANEVVTDAPSPGAAIAGTSPNGAASTGPRRIDSPPAQPVDLLDTAGGSVAKRVGARRARGSDPRSS